MLPNDQHLHLPHSSCANYKRVFCFLSAAFLLLLVSSCQDKRPAAATGYSDAFKPVYQKTSEYFYSNRTPEGLHYLDSAFYEIEKPSLDDRFRVLGFHYVYWKKYIGDNKKALLYADSMLMLSKKSTTQKQYVTNYVEANMAIGDADFSMQKFDDAYKHYFEGYRLGKNYLDNGALSDYSYRMGMILYKMQHYKLAAAYFKESIRLSAPTQDKFADFYRIQEVLDDVALSYKHNNEPDSAIVYFDKALAYINANATRFNVRPNMIEMARGVVYGNKADVLLAKGNVAGGEELLKKSIDINLKKGNDNSDAELTEIKLAQLYLGQNENDKLFDILQNLKVQFDGEKNQAAQADWNRLMSAYYQRKNDYKASFDYLQAYSRLRDSSNVALEKLRESDINQQLTSFEKQYQIDSLKNHGKLQTAYLYIAVVSTIMALAIIFMVFRNYKRSKNDVQIVNALNNRVNLQKIDLENTLEELKSSSLEKDRILRAVAHDLRNPIGGIASLTNVMADDDYNDEQREMIGLIKETADNSLELINELLEVTNNGTARLKKKLVEINSLLNNSVELLRFKAAEKKQHISLELMDNPVELMISREKIWRVLSNLITNAIKFSPLGATIAVGVTDAGKEVEITVKDSGIGIPDDIKDKVFNVFTDAKRTGTAGEKSFGLGLSISRQIVEKHNGKLWFESNDGAGTTFLLRLPKQ